MLANECGKDLYVCLPVRASNNYLTNVANLMCYGSDGVNPYTSPQANPVYPPLNPNLRVILEHENEVWNWAFANAGNNIADLLAAYTNNTPDWHVVNYDGAYTSNPSARGCAGTSCAVCAPRKFSARSSATPPWARGCG